MNTSHLVISDIIIRQDADTRFCLNDLHRAAGDEKRHQPSNWLATQQAKELIDEIKNSTPDITGVPNHSSEMRTTIEVINGGNNRGTYAVKELVYAYAMWISPKFHLHVIRAYDALVMGEKPDSQPLNRLELLKTISDNASRLVHSTNPLERQVLAETLCEMNHMAGLADKLNDKITQEVALPSVNNQDKVIIHAFWRNYETLKDTDDLNYSGHPKKIAIHLTTYLRACQRANLSTGINVDNESQALKQLKAALRSSNHPYPRLRINSLGMALGYRKGGAQ